MCIIRVNEWNRSPYLEGASNIHWTLMMPFLDVSRIISMSSSCKGGTCSSRRFNFVFEPFFHFFTSHFSFLSHLLSFCIQLSKKNQSGLSFNFLYQFWSFSLDFYFFISSLNIRLVNLFFDVKFGLYSWNFFF